MDPEIVFRHSRMRLLGSRYGNYVILFIVERKPSNLYNHKYNTFISVLLLVDAVSMGLKLNGSNKQGTRLVGLAVH